MTTPAAARLVLVEGWPLALSGDEPRVRDLDLADRLGYERPRKIRELISRLVDAGKLPGIEQRPSVGRYEIRPGVEHEQTVTEYWLSEAEALKVTAKSETAVADALLDDIIRVFRLAVRGELPSAPLTRATALKFLVDESLAEGKHGAAVAFLNAARALDKGQLSLPGVDAPSPLKPRSLRAYHEDILAALGKGELRAADLLRAVPRNKSRVWIAIGQLLASGRVVRRRENGSRSFYSLANPQPTETLQ